MVPLRASLLEYTEYLSPRWKQKVEEMRNMMEGERESEAKSTDQKNPNTELTNLRAVTWPAKIHQLPGRLEPFVRFLSAQCKFYVVK